MGACVVAVVGATATGKSGLAIALAQALGGEVVNADSMQLYRRMDIGTAKLSVAERAGVPHHLLDIWDVKQPASVAEYQLLARAAIDDIQARGLVPILAGGSGLYVRGALDKLSFPRTDPELRQRLEAELAENGPGPLHERLAGLDAEAAAAILPSNGRRIVRALEVIELSGEPFSATMPEYESVYPSVQIGIKVGREELDARIAARVDRMWQDGFVAEVRELEQRGLRDGLTASRALGYREVLRFLAGECSLEQSQQDTVRGTRKFARRQESWFRRDPRVHWLDGDCGSAALHASALLFTRSFLPESRVTQNDLPGCCGLNRPDHSRGPAGARTRDAVLHDAPGTTIGACGLPRGTAPKTTSLSCPTRTVRST